MIRITRERPQIEGQEYVEISVYTGPSTEGKPGVCSTDMKMVNGVHREWVPESWCQTCDEAMGDEWTRVSEFILGRPVDGEYNHIFFIVPMELRTQDGTEESFDL